MLAWQWALIALAIAAVVSSIALGIYLLWRRRVWHNKQQIQATRCCPGPHNQRRRRGADFGDEEQVRKKDSDSAIERVSPRFPSSFLLQQYQQINTNTTPSRASDSVITTEDLEKAQHLVMMPLSAPPPRAGRKPKLCVPQQSKADIDCPEKNTSSSSAKQQKEVTQRDAGGSSNDTKSDHGSDSSGAVDHDDGNDEGHGDHTNILPNTAASVTSITTSAKRPFVLTPFLESPTTTSTSGRSTAEHISANATSNDSNIEPYYHPHHHHHHHYSYPQQQYCYQEHQQRYHHRRGSSATTAASSSNNPSNGNNNNNSNKHTRNNSNESDSSPVSPPPPSSADHHHHRSHSVNPSSSSAAMRSSFSTTTAIATGQWRGPTPPFTLLREDSLNKSSNYKN